MGILSSKMSATVCCFSSGRSLLFCPSVVKACGGYGPGFQVVGILVDSQGMCACNTPNIDRLPTMR